MVKFMKIYKCLLMNKFGELSMKLCSKREKDCAKLLMLISIKRLKVVVLEVVTDSLVF